MSTTHGRQAAPNPLSSGLVVSAGSHPARVAQGLGLAPSALVVLVWLVWATDHGGFFPRDWYPAAVLLAAVLAVSAVGRNGRTPNATVVAALTMLGAWVIWSFCSMLWAGSPGSAWEAANKLLLLWLMVAVLAVAPWRPATAAALLGAWACGVAIVCAVDLVGSASANEVGDVFLIDRWRGPVGYPNASAALAAMAFWGLLLLSVRPQTPRLLRPPALAAAVFSLQCSMLPESRGAVLALLAVVPLVLVVGPNRLGLLLRLAIATAALSLSAAEIFAVHDAGRGLRSVHGALDAVAPMIGLATILALVLGAVLIALEDRWPFHGSTIRRSRGTVLAVLALSAVGVGTLAATNGPRMVDVIDQRSVERDQRHDTWRVAFGAYRERPLAGIGVGNFERRYTARRTMEQRQRFVHSVWLRAMAETGSVGLVLLVGFVGVTAFGLLALARRVGLSARAVVTAVTAILLGFCVHASVDWLEEMPALAGPAFGLPVIALVAGWPSVTRPGQSMVGWLGLMSALAAICVLTPAWLSVRDVDLALERAATGPTAAYRTLDRAATLNPLSVRPHLGAGIIALERGELARARSAFRGALEAEEHWLGHFELALVDAGDGRFAAARRRLRLAASLSAHEPLIAEARRLLRSRSRLGIVALNRRLRGGQVYRRPSQLP